MASLVEYTEPVWRGLNMRALKVDEAYMVIKSEAYDQYTLYTLSDDCYSCAYKKLADIPPEPEPFNVTLKMNVARPLKMKMIPSSMKPDVKLRCEHYLDDLREFGVYNVTLYRNGSCGVYTDKEGVNIYASFVTVLVLLASCFAVFTLLQWTWRRFHVTDVIEISTQAPVEGSESANDESSTKVMTNVATTSAMSLVGADVTTNRTPAVERMRSLDAFRGMAIVLMIFVNSGGGDYWWIEHATWNGLHVADVVFPSFLWIMGVCIPISVRSQLRRNASRQKICWRIVVRSVKLFLIGLCLNSINGPQLADLRIMGVLQRFGVAYLVCGIAHVFSTTMNTLQLQVLWRRVLVDLILFKTELLAMLTLIIAHLIIVFGLPVPQCPLGYLGPGGLHAHGAYRHCTGGATGLIDKVILGQSHIYQHPTAKHVYGAEPFDPEGIFGCLLTIVQVFFGVLTGVIILTHTDWLARLKRWMAWSLALGLAGGLLCLFSKEGGVIPINKNLWSLSYVFVTTALAFCLLSLLYVSIDVLQLWKGFPFVESGKNAILMYVGHTIMHKMLPWHWRIGAMNTHFVLLLEAAWNTLLWIGIAVHLNAKKIYYSL